MIFYLLSVISFAGLTVALAGMLMIAERLLHGCSKLAGFNTFTQDTQPTRLHARVFQLLGV